MRDLVAPVLLLLGVGLDALPSLRLASVSSTTASAHVSRTQASDAAEVCSTCVSSSTVSSSLLSTSTQPAPLSDMSFELRGKLLFRDGVESR